MTTRVGSLLVRVAQTFAVVVVGALLGADAFAQVDTDREEVTVESFGASEEQARESVLDEAQSGPQTTANVFDAEIPIEEIERTETALSRLRRLVDDTPVSDTARAEYMFRLAELYYNRARFYEQRAFRRRDEAFELREINPPRARAYEENSAADLAQSDVFAEDAIRLYADIYTLYQDSYPDIDAVLYFLGANMLQLQQNEAARQMFETLAREYPQSTFLAQALLMLGDLLFVEGEMQDAEIYYAAVREFPESPSYSYATYKLAWCVYNLAGQDADYEDALGLMYEVVELEDANLATGRTRLRRDALRDMTLFYSMIYPAELAFEFFEAIAPSDSLDLVARLARIYGDRAQYEASDTLYRALIERSPNQPEIIGYQREIVRNARPGGDDIALVREVRRLIAVFELAQGFEAMTPEITVRWQGETEELVRQLATTYHSEAQTTLNEELYALAYELYQDYARAFSDSPYGYTMSFFFAELLYRNEEWGAAAAAYDRTLALSDGAGPYDEEATYAACLSYVKMADLSMTEQVQTGQASTEEDALPPVPEPREIPSEYFDMMTACDRYLAVESDDEIAAEIEYVVAFTYYEYDHLDEAVDRFGSLALSRGRIDTERAQVSAELLLDSLALQRRFTDMKTWIDRFKTSESLNTGAFAVRLQELSEQVDFKQCQDSFTNESFEACGHCYIAFVETHFESGIADRGLYNAGVCFGQAGKIDFAISAYRYLTEYFPSSELVPETTYELGRMYHRMAMYERAAEQYEEYYATTPRGENVRNALANASQFRHGLGQYSEAIATYGDFIRVSDDDEPEELRGIAEAVYQQALVEVERDRVEEAVRLFQRVISRYDEVLPSRAVESHVQIADLYLRRGGRSVVDAAYAAYADAVSLVSGLSDETRSALSPAAMDAVAKAQFMIGDRVFEAFESVRLEGNEARVQAGIQEKIDLGREATTSFEQVFAYQRPGWAICAFTRLGRLYHVFYEQIIDAPIPAGLSALEEEAYRTSIEEQAEAQKLEAMDRYARAITIARDANWFNDCSDEAAGFYTELDPTFKAGTEVRVAPGYDREQFYVSPFVTERSAVEPSLSEEAAP